MWLSRLRKNTSTVYSTLDIRKDRPITEDANKSEAPSPTIANWPIGPRRVAIEPLWLLVDFLVLMAPIAFLALAVLACRLDGKDISDRGRKIQEAIILGPTLFPLAFTALAGRSLKKMALWRAQEGTTIGVLEQILGSQSLAATVSHATSLRSLDLLAIGLLMLWALSPLGGQSALRLVYETNSPVLESRLVFSVDPDVSSPLPAGGFNVDAFNRVDSVVSTALMTADTLEWSPSDLWNHPKIPRLEQLEQEERGNETNRAWHTIEHQANHSYAALTGVNAINLSKNGDANFTVPYEYMYFDCKLSPGNNITTSFDAEHGRNVTEPNYHTQIEYLRGLNAAGILQSEGAFNPDNNYTIAPGDFPPTSSVNDRGFFIYTIGKAGHKQDSLLYGSKMVSESYYLFECSMRSIMIEANMLCESASCSVGRLRRINVPRSKRRGVYLPFDIVNDGMYTRKFLQYFGRLGGDTGAFSSNPVDAYIFGNTQFRPNNSVKNWTEYVFDPQRSIDMSHRMTRVMNTFWDSSRWPLAVTRNDPWGKTSINETSGEPFEEMTMIKTEATVTRRILIYRANSAWVACLVICSGVPLLLGIFSLCLSFHITVPDIFDYASSFTRDNPNINVPRGGSSLSGAERARLLKRLPVQLGDANAGAEVGYIALRSIDGSSDSEQGKVRKDRMYY